MMDSLTFIARYLDNTDQRRDLLLKTLQLFIQQGITAKKASDTAQSSHKVHVYIHMLITEPQLPWLRTAIHTHRPRC